MWEYRVINIQRVVGGTAKKCLMARQAVQSQVPAMRVVCYAWVKDCAGRQKSGRVQRCGEQAGSEGGGSGDSQAPRGARGVRGGPRRGAQLPVLHGDNLTDSGTDKIRRSSRQK
ncbi:hypothetical protein ACOMHN_004941 [Nucella lapillus]